MAQLTWRNVDAPDFRTSLEGIRTFADLVNSGFQGLDQGLGRFDQAQSMRMNNALALEAAAATDPEAAKALQASLLTRPDRNRITAQTAGMVSGRAGQLMNEALTAENLDFTKYSNDRTQDRNASRDAASPIQQAMAAAYAKGDIAGARNLFEQNKTTLGKLGYEDFQSMLEGGQRLASGDLGYQRGQFGFGREKVGAGRDDTNWARSEQEYARNEAAQNLYASLYDVDDMADVERLIGSSKVDDRTKMLVRQKFGIGGPKEYGALDMSGGTGATGDFQFAAPQQAVASTLKSGGLSDAVVAGFLGNFHVEGGYTGNQGDGGSAGGIAQWRNERRANFKSVIGRDPVGSSPADQARFVLWELNNPAKAGMTQGQADAIKNAKDPRTAAALIDQHFERSDGKARSARVQMADRALEALTGLQRGVDRQATATNLALENPLARVFTETANDTRSARQVAVEVAGKDKSIDPVWLETQINKEMAIANTGKTRKVTPAMVAAVIQQYAGSQSSTESWGRLVPDSWAGNTIGSDLVYDKASVRKELGKLDSPEMQAALDAQAQQGIASQQEAAAVKARDAALARLQAKQQAAARGKRVNPAAEIMALEAANAALAATRGAIDDPRSGLRTRPTPPEIAAPSRVIPRQGRVVAPARGRVSNQAWANAAARQDPNSILFRR